MRPCDVESQHDIDTKLNESGIRHNDEGISIGGAGSVLLTIGPATLRISKRRFKMFAQWFLEDQIKEGTDEAIEVKNSEDRDINGASECKCCGHMRCYHTTNLLTTNYCTITDCSCNQFEAKDPS